MILECFFGFEDAVVENLLIVLQPSTGAFGIVIGINVKF